VATHRCEAFGTKKPQSEKFGHLTVRGDDDCEPQCSRERGLSGRVNISESSQASLKLNNQVFWVRSAKGTQNFVSTQFFDVPKAGLSDIENTKQLMYIAAFGV